MSELFTRLIAVVALLLAFGMLRPGRLWPWLYAAQSVVLALSIAINGGDWARLSAVPILLAQAVAIPRLLRGQTGEAPMVALATLAGGLVLVALAAAVPVGEGFAGPLALVLLGLLAAAVAADMRFGVLLLLNGAEAVSDAAWAVLALAVLAAVVAGEGVPRWGALR